MKSHGLQSLDENTRDKRVADDRDGRWPSEAERPGDEPDESADFDGIEPNDTLWDAFLADEDERDPEPDPRDFYREAED